MSKNSAASVKGPEEPGGLSSGLEHRPYLSSSVGGLSHPSEQCSMPGICGKKNVTGKGRLAEGNRVPLGT